MLTMLARSWWLLALRGLMAILFGLAVIMFGATLLVILFGAYAVVDGAFAILTALRSRTRNPQWWTPLLEGLAGVAVGVFTLIWPGVATLVMLALIAAWALVTGIMEIIAAIRLREEIEGEWMLALSGFVSVLFGLLLAVQPVAGLVAIAWVIGIYAIVFGGLMIALGFRLRSWASTIQQMFDY